jgi:hypothetical protein
MTWVRRASSSLSHSTMLALLRCLDISLAVPIRPNGFCVAIIFFISLSPSPRARSSGQARVDPAAEDADDEAAHEEQRRLARKQPRRNRANPREIHHDTSRAERIGHSEFRSSSTARPVYHRRRLLERHTLTLSSQSRCSSEWRSAPPGVSARVRF